MNPMCKNDMLFSDLASDQPHMNSDLPQVMKVSLGADDDSMLPSPDSPVFAELTTPSNRAKGPMFQDRVVPGVGDFNPCENYMSTAYSPLFQDTKPFCEGFISDDPLGASNNVLAMQETDLYDLSSTSTIPGQLESFPPWNQWNDCYQDISSFQHTNPFDCPLNNILPGVDQILFKNMLDGTNPTHHKQRGHHSAGEDTEFDSESEASFTLSTSPVPIDNTFLPMLSHHHHVHQSRTHNYQRKTIDKSLSHLTGVTKKTSKRGRGRPRKIDSMSTCSDDSDEEVTTRRGRGRREAMRGNHLWEFIRDLLKDNYCSPKYIRWEDRKDGVFRFVNSEAVARMWGQKKNNPQMTYEKLSRAMRYYYKREILERVDGRRLVYKFGKNALGWREAAGLDVMTTEQS